MMLLVCLVSDMYFVPVSSFFPVIIVTMKKWKHSAGQIYLTMLHFLSNAAICCTAAVCTLDVLVLQAIVLPAVVF